MSALGKGGRVTASSDVKGQPGEGHHRTAEIDSSDPLPNGIVLIHRPRSLRPPLDQVRSVDAQCKRRSPDEPAPACRISFRRVPSSQRSNEPAVKHRMDETGKSAPIVPKQAHTADSEARQLRHHVRIRAAPQSEVTCGKPCNPNSTLLTHALERM
jgi:hypothetical protein